MAETFHTLLPNSLQVIPPPPPPLFLALGSGSHSRAGWISEPENALYCLLVKLGNVTASPQSEEKVISHFFFLPQEVKRD